MAIDIVIPSLCWELAQLQDTSILQIYHSYAYSIISRFVFTKEASDKQLNNQDST